jgi:hypothetical protein
MKSLRGLLHPLGTLINVFWSLSVGAIGLYLFFLVMGAIAPGDLLWMTIGAATLAVLSIIHFIRVRRALEDHKHDDLARTVHRMRERRGF